MSAEAMWDCVVSGDADTADAADAVSDAASSALPARVLPKASWRLQGGAERQKGSGRLLRGTLWRNAGK